MIYVEYFHSAISNKSYIQVFNWFYNDTGYYDWLLMFLDSGSPLLSEDEWACAMRFIGEYINNKGSRINFPNTSADGIRLFRSTASFLVSQGKKVLFTEDKYKCLKLYLRCCNSCLTGGFANFGVFELYNDSILPQFLQTSLYILLNLQINELEAYPKQNMLAFALLENISKAQVTYYINLPTDAFLNVCKFIKSGLESKVKEIINSSCTTIEMIFNHHYENLISANNNRINDKKRQEIDQMNQHLTENLQIIQIFFVDLFDLLITFNNVHWQVARPLIILIVLFPDIARTIQETIIQSQSDNQTRGKTVSELFIKLLSTVNNNLSKDTKDKFTATLASFRTEFTNVIDVSLFYKAFNITK